MEADETPVPLDLGFFRADRIVRRANRGTELVFQAHDITLIRVISFGIASQFRIVRADHHLNRHDILQFRSLFEK
jgi:hypothetical protein